MSDPRPIALTVNGVSTHRFVEPRVSLADFLRRDLGLTGTHVGCEMGACGACLVQVDGVAVHSCLMLAVQATGARVDTIEGLSDSGALRDLQEAFHARNALQCGFCTPGVLLSAAACLADARLAEDGIPSRAAIRDALSGNYCRCTGYEAIVDAIETVATARQAAARAALGTPA